MTFLLNLELSQYLQPVLGLVIGGAAAAPLAGYLSRVLPPRVLIIAVAVVVGILSAGEYRPPRLAVCEGPVRLTGTGPADCRVVASQMEARHDRAARLAF